MVVMVKVLYSSRWPHWLRWLIPLQFFVLAGTAFAEPGASAPGGPVDAPSPVELQLQHFEELHQRHALSYERHTNQEMNDIVFRGIHSGDDEVVRRTVEDVAFEAQMGGLSRAIIERTVSAEQGAALREGLHQTRSFGNVPGLRDFLLDYVREGVSKDGWAASDPFLELGEWPVWVSALGALLTYFPGDPAVEELLLEYYNALQSLRPDLAGHALHLLNVGQFASAELLATRIEALEHPAASVAGAAAEGLGLTRTDEGLAALGAGLDRRDEALGEIVYATLAYGARAGPYLPTLRELRRREKELAPFLEPLPIYPKGVFHSMGRVEVLSNRAAYLGPESLAHTFLLEQFIPNQARHDDERVNDIVFEGIHSGDAEAIAHTVRAIGVATVAGGLRDWLSAHAGEEVARRKPRWSPARPNAVDDQLRSFHKVLGLRDFLLAYVRRGLAEEGVAAFAAETPPAWTFGFHTLAVLFPGDVEVRRVLRDLHAEMERTKRSVNGPLRMLNAGRFHGADVDALRKAALNGADPLAAQAGAEGLAMTLTDDGLGALVGALGRTDAALAGIVDAIGRFGVRALPHNARLLELAEGGPFESAAVQQTVEEVAANMGVIAAWRSQQLEASE